MPDTPDISERVGLERDDYFGSAHIFRTTEGGEGFQEAVDSLF